MKITEVKKNMNRLVKFNSPKQHIKNGSYILTACILRQKNNGDYYYLAELTDALQKNSVIIASLNEITEADAQ